MMCSDFGQNNEDSQKTDMLITAFELRILFDSNIVERNAKNSRKPGKC